MACKLKSFFSHLFTIANLKWQFVEIFSGESCLNQIFSVAVQTRDSFGEFVFKEFQFQFQNNFNYNFYLTLLLIVSFQLNIPALGFSPLLNTIPKLHDHNEYINADTYLKGIEMYKKIIPSIANS